jgi:hypothetical protein
VVLPSLPLCHRFSVVYHFKEYILKGKKKTTGAGIEPHVTNPKKEPMSLNYMQLTSSKHEIGIDNLNQSFIPIRSMAFFRIPESTIQN